MKTMKFKVFDHDEVILTVFKGNVKANFSKF